MSLIALIDWTLKFSIVFRGPSGRCGGGPEQKSVCIMRKARFVWLITLTCLWIGICMRPVCDLEKQSGLCRFGFKCIETKFRLVSWECGH